MIKSISVTLFLLCASVSAADTNSTAGGTMQKKNTTLLQSELQKAIALEKKYAKEQKFYDAETYDFKGAEVNKASLANVPLIEPDSEDIDSDAILGMSEEEGLSW